MKISICSFAFSLSVLMLESLWSGGIWEGRGRGKGRGEDRREGPGSRPGEMWPSEEDAGERGAEACCCVGGWPGEVEEEEGRAVEGKQGMEEEVTWTECSLQTCQGTLERIVK